MNNATVSRSMLLPGLFAILATAAGCSAGSEPQNATHPEAPAALAAIQSTPESEASLHVASWELYESKLHGYNVLARDRVGKVLHAINVHVISQSQSPYKRVRLDFGHDAVMVVDQELGVVHSSLTREHLEISKGLGDALAASKQRGETPYSCLGDILWAVGGLIATIPACAAVIPGVATGPIDALAVAACVGTFVGGAAAGTVSAWQDCTSNSSGFQGTAQVSVEVSYDYYWDPYNDCWAYMSSNQCYSQVGSGGY
jgi:hypothetical protein